MFRGEEAFAPFSAGVHGTATRGVDEGVVSGRTELDGRPGRSGRTTCCRTCAEHQGGVEGEYEDKSWHAAHSLAAGR